MAHIPYRIALLNIGTELLKGRTVNTNAAWLGRTLQQAGLALSRTLVIHDEGEAIDESLRSLLQHHDCVIVTGGLGPTKDDITKHRLEAFFGGGWVMHQPTLERLEEWCRQRNRVMNEPMRLQAMLPASCTPLTNTIGSAPGMAFQQEGKWVFSLPGVPREMQLLVEREVLPRITQHGRLWVTGQVRLYGKAESEIAQEMAEMEHEFPTGLAVSWLPTDGEVKIELSLPETQDARAQMDALVQRLATHFGQWLITTQDAGLEQVLAAELQRHGLTIATAESCTAGRVAAALTTVSGSSRHFVGGVVAYSEAVKQDALGVPASLIQQHTVVSAEVAAAMATGVRARMQSDLAVATTGAIEVVEGDPVYAQPFVFIAVAHARGVEVTKIHVWQDRQSNLRRATQSALFMALRQVRQHSSWA